MLPAPRRTAVPCHVGHHSARIRGALPPGRRPGSCPRALGEGDRLVLGRSIWSSTVRVSSMIDSCVTSRRRGSTGCSGPDVAPPCSRRRVGATTVVFFARRERCVREPWAGPTTAPRSTRSDVAEWPTGTGQVLSIDGGHGRAPQGARRVEREARGDAGVGLIDPDDGVRACRRAAGARVPGPACGGSDARPSRCVRRRGGAANETEHRAASMT